MGKSRAISLTLLAHPFNASKLQSRESIGNREVTWRAVVKAFERPRREEKTGPIGLLSGRSRVGIAPGAPFFISRAPGRSRIGLNIDIPVDDFRRSSTIAKGA